MPLEDLFGAQLPAPTGSQLLVGCEDGSAKLFQIIPDNSQIERNFDRKVTSKIPAGIPLVPTLHWLHRLHYCYLMSNRVVVFIRCLWVGSIWVCLSRSVSYGGVAFLSDGIAGKCTSGTQLPGWLWKNISSRMLICSPLPYLIKKTISQWTQLRGQYPFPGGLCDFQQQWEEMGANKAISASYSQCANCGPQPYSTDIWKPWHTLSHSFSHGKKKWR